MHGIMWMCSKFKKKTEFLTSAPWGLQKLGANELISIVYFWSQGTDYEQIAHEADV